MNAQHQAAADLAFFIHETLELMAPAQIDTCARLANEVLDAIYLPQLKLCPEEIVRRKLLAECRRPHLELDADRVAGAKHAIATSGAPLPPNEPASNIIAWPVVPKRSERVLS